jgi:hypothetical protein
MLKFQHSVIFAAIVASAYFASTIYYNHTEPVTQAKQIVKNAIYDGPSALFENVQYHKETGTTCGKVNAKNLYGAYVGFTFFTVDKSGELALIPPQSGYTLEEKIKNSQERLDWLTVFTKTCPGQ